MQKLLHAMTQKWPPLANRKRFILIYSYMRTITQYLLTYILTTTDFNCRTQGQENIISPPPSGSMPRFLITRSKPSSIIRNRLNTGNAALLKPSTDGSTYIQNIIK